MFHLLKIAPQQVDILCNCFEHHKKSDLLVLFIALVCSLFLNDLS